jgi:hypothetical protein
MASPLKMSQAVLDFIREKCLAKQQISDWLDPALDNRPHLV